MQTSRVFLIGSQAIVLDPKQVIGTMWEPILERRKKGDIDYASTSELFEFGSIGGRTTEYHPMRELFDFPLYKYKVNDVLLSIKLSHSIYDIKFAKTMWDIQLLKYLGAEPIPEIVDALRVKWCESPSHKRHHRGFNFPHSELFEDNVERLIPHNSLHKIVSMAIRGSPIPKWEELRDNNLLNNLEDVDYKDRLSLAIEEAIVFTIERHYIRALGCGVQSAYLESLNDLITRCSPEEEALWMVWNYIEIRKLPVETFNLINNLIFTIYGKYYTNYKSNGNLGLGKIRIGQ